MPQRTTIHLGIVIGGQVVRWYSDPYTTMPKAVVNATDFYWLPTNRLATASSNSASRSSSETAFKWPDR